MNLALITLSLLAAIAAAEAALRIAGISHPIFFQADKLLGTSHIPGVDGTYTREGRGHIRINTYGFRDPDFSVLPSTGVTRIAVLGDSYVSAFEVEERQRFTSILKSRLSETLPSRIEVLNFGVQGYGTGQQLLQLRDRVSRFEPDIVLLAFFSGNDIVDNSRAIKGADRYPYFVYVSNRLVLDERFRASATFERRNSHMTRALVGAANYSRILQLANNLRFSQARRAVTADLPWGGVGGATEPGLYNAIYVPPPDARWSEAWRITEGLVARLAEESRTIGAEFGMVVLSNPIQVHPDAMLRARFEASLGVDDLFYPDRELARIGERTGVDVLLLAPAMQLEATARSIFFHGFGDNLGTGHWNTNGHAYAGAKIASWLTDTGPLARQLGQGASGTRTPGPPP